MNFKNIDPAFFTSAIGMLETMNPDHRKQMMSTAFEMMSKVIEKPESKNKLEQMVKDIEFPGESKEEKGCIPSEITDSTKSTKDTNSKDTEQELENLADEIVKDSKEKVDEIVKEKPEENKPSFIEQYKSAIMFASGMALGFAIKIGFGMC
jgi:cell division septum initiation protein DivIVA